MKLQCTINTLFDKATQELKGQKISLRQAAKRKYNIKKKNENIFNSDGNLFLMQHGKN